MKINRLEQLTPVGKTAVLEQVPADEITEGGIILPDKAQTKRKFYWIRKIGEFPYSQELIDRGLIYPDELHITPDTFKVGDLVAIHDNSHTLYTMDDGRIFALVFLRDINLKIEVNNAD
jgi:co-chaperonin GroES (HSP10)